MTNKQLDLCINEIAAGNREAFRQLYDELKNPIFLFALSLSHDYQTAEDVEQETFLNIMQCASKYRIGTNAKAWIFGIARNCCADKYKAASRYVPLEPDILSSFPNEEKEFNRVENSIIALEALSILDESEREIVSLYLFCDLKQTEIAKLLKISYSSVRAKYAYAIKKLKRYFKNKGVFIYDE